MTRTTVLLADDHVLVLEAFKRLLEPACHIVGTVTDGRALLDAIESLSPDVVLMDIAMPRLNGLDACEHIVRRRPATRVVMLTMAADPDTAAEALRRGASGYLLKTCTAAEVFDAIEHVRRGRVYVTPAVARDEPAAVFAERASRSKGGLSLREREVLQLLAEGKSMKEAASVLGVTARTVAFHKYAIKQRLGLKSGAELVQHAVALGLVDVRRPPG
jgi:DNA-binding NarL/FixJ family response regulator